MNFGFFRPAIAAVAVLVGLSGCATAPPADDPDAVAAYEEINDPLEPMNRYFFELHLALDKLLLRPVAHIYHDAVPDLVQEGIRNFLDNLRSPLIFANDLLQGEVERAGDTFGRFVANSFIGMGGIFDVVPDIERHSEDFGQTLAVWGVPEGPYLFLPLLGPAPPRDLTGRVIESYADPLNIWLRNEDKDELIYARTAISALDFRAANIKTFDELERTSLDFYAALRSLYRQSRGDAIRNGAPPPATELKDISFDLDDDEDS